MRLLAAIAALTLLATPTLADPPRDPFAPFERATLIAGDAPLQRFDLEQLKLVGVVVSTASPRALIEGPDGVSHLARVGDWIGTSWGRIAAIRSDGIEVVEQFRDPLGGLHQHRAALRLPRPTLGAPGAARPAARR